MNLFSKLPDFGLPKSEGYYLEEIAVGEFLIKLPKGEVLFIPDFMSKKLSDRSIEYLLENENNLKIDDKRWRDFEYEKLGEIKFKNTRWSHDKIKMFGKETYLPRYSAWYGDENMRYKYSGLLLSPIPWNDGLTHIRNLIENKTGEKFNSVLLNWYRDGKDYIGWHSDSEKSLGVNPIIASINFGASREFKLRTISNEKVEVAKFNLSHGSLLVMKGETQHNYQHSVPKSKNNFRSRINLTFRQIKMHTT